jgi:hypothetical protein
MDQAVYDLGRDIGLAYHELGVDDQKTLDLIEDMVQRGVAFTASVWCYWGKCAVTADPEAAPTPFGLYGAFDEKDGTPLTPDDPRWFMASHTALVVNGALRDDDEAVAAVIASLRAELGEAEDVITWVMCVCLALLDIYTNAVIADHEDCHCEWKV